MTAQFLRVALPRPLFRLFTYRLPQEVDQAVQPGQRVLVPFGEEVEAGVVVELLETPDLPPARVKPIHAVVGEDPPYSSQLLAFTKDIASYYVEPLGLMLSAALPAGLKVVVQRHLSLTEEGKRTIGAGAFKSKEQGQALLFLREEGEMEANALAKALSLPSRSDLLRKLRSAGAVAQRVEARIRVPPKERKFVRLTEKARRDFQNALEVCGRSERKKRLLALLQKQEEPILLSELANAIGGNYQIVRDLRDLSIVEITSEVVRRAPSIPTDAASASPLPTLTKAQEKAVAKFLEEAKRGTYCPSLLFGVTGSGKTRVYIEVIKAMLQEGKTALYLVPEIALTPQLARTLGSVFGEDLAIFHSGLGEGERCDEWRRCQAGEARVVLGTRSAIFTPLKNLGVIVVDEEQDPSFKQQERPMYHARDMALIRGTMVEALVILGSATPSIETYHNALTERFVLVSLPERIAKRPLPKIEVVDMRAEFQSKGKELVLSRTLLEAIEGRMEREEQVILLLNRRGYANFMLCRGCGEAIFCPRCSITLTYHQTQNLLLCHYCNLTRSVAERCPSCREPYLQSIGYGTQRIEELLSEQFPSARILRMDRDTTRRKGAYDRIIRQFENNEGDILLGTQMIAKGHHFADVTLVGSLLADYGLRLPDFRATERSFQLLHQLAGRAGRGKRPGKLIVQTYIPDHYCFRLAGEEDYPRFYEQEVEYRSKMNYPPFCALANLVVRDRRLDRAIALARKLKDELLAIDEAHLQVLGPAPAPLRKIRGEFRFQILVKSRKRNRIKDDLNQLVERLEASHVPLQRVQIDVDPIELM